MFNGYEKDLIGETNNLIGESLGTSIQVQMGNSVDIFSVQDERMAVSYRSQQKVRSQGIRLKVRTTRILIYICSIKLYDAQRNWYNMNSS